MGTVQTVFSSAENLGEVRGPSVCFSAGGGSGPAVAGGVCASFTDSSYDDVSSVSVVVGAGFGTGIDTPGGPGGGLQYGHTGATELPWVESALEGFVEEVDERTGWTAFLEAIHDPRAWG